MELNKARALALQENWLTVNELRARSDPPLDPVPGHDGEVIPGLERVRQAGLSRVLKEVET